MSIKTNVNHEKISQKKISQKSFPELSHFVSWLINLLMFSPEMSPIGSLPIISYSF